VRLHEEAEVTRFDTSGGSNNVVDEDEEGDEGMERATERDEVNTLSIGEGDVDCSAVASCDGLVSMSDDEV